MRKVFEMDWGTKLFLLGLILLGLAGLSLVVGLKWMPRRWGSWTEMGAVALGALGFLSLAVGTALEGQMLRCGGALAVAVFLLFAARERYHRARETAQRA